MLFGQGLANILAIYFMRKPQLLTQKQILEDYPLAFSSIVTFQ